VQHRVAFNLNFTGETMPIKFARRVRIIIGIAMAAVTLSAFAAQKCLIDESPMIWTGETRVEGGKLLYVMKCLQGHLALALDPN
jgi:hypothetical protein